MPEPQAISPAGYASTAINVRGRVTSVEVQANIKPSHLEELLYWDSEDKSEGGELSSKILAVLAFFSKNRTVPHWRFDRWEQKPSADFVTAREAETAGATTIRLNAGDVARLVDGQMLYNPATDEVMRIPRSGATTDLDTTTNQITNVTRGIGSAGAAIAQGQQLVILGTARPEGGIDPVPNFYLDENDYGYTQEIDKVFGYTNRDKHIRQYSGRTPELTRKEARRDFMRYMANAFIWGKRASSTEGGYPITYCDGLRNFAKTCRGTVAGKELTWRFIKDFFRPYFMYGSDLKHLFAGQGVLSILDDLVPSGAIRLEVKEMRGQEISDIKFGWQLAYLHFRYGTLVLHREKRWERISGLHDKALILDAENVGIVTREGGEVTLLENRQANNVTHELHAWYCDKGPDLRVEGSHGWVDGWPVNS